VRVVRTLQDLEQEMRATAAMGDDSLDDDSCECGYRTALCVGGHGFSPYFSKVPCQPADARF
jgi:hypothetical protein